MRFGQIGNEDILEREPWHLHGVTQTALECNGSVTPAGRSGSTAQVAITDRR